MIKNIFLLITLVSATMPAWGQQAKNDITVSVYEALTIKAMEYASGKQYLAAAGTFQEILRKHPGHASNTMIMVNLATIQRELKEYDSALLLYNTVLTNHPKNVFVLHNRAALYCEINRFEDAMKDYNAILLYQDDDQEALYRRGLLYLNNKEPLAAEADFEAVLQLQPENMKAKLAKGMVLKFRNEWKEAEDLYSDLLYKYRNSAQLYYERAECYLNQEKLGRAQTDFNKAKDLGYHSPNMYLLRGRLLLAQFDKRQAKENFLKAKEEGVDGQVIEDYLKLCRLR